MKSKPYRVSGVEPRAIDKALAQRPETVAMAHMVLARFHRRGRIPGLPEGPPLSRIAAAEYHRELPARFLLPR
jgi:hypothetical protein